MIEIIPASEHAERSILGAILLDSSRLLEIADVLCADDFFLDSHKRIFLRMTEVERNGSKLDIITLCEALQRNREMENVGGRAYLFSLTENLPHSPEIDEYIAIVRDKAICRQLLRTSEVLGARAMANDESGLEIAAWGSAAIAEIVESNTLKTEVFGAEDMAVEAMARIAQNAPRDPVLPTGFLPLDEFTGGGIRVGELWIVGAAPSRGKTTLARQIACHTVRRGTPTYVQSGEMDKESWFDVTACLLRRIPATHAREPRLMNSAERDEMQQGIQELAALPLYLSDTGNIHVDRLLWNAAREKERHGIRLLVVDYVQIVKGPGASRLEQVGNVAERLRVFAKEQKIAVLLLSQMARPEGRNLNSRPTMFGLKETGRLEEAAHTVLLPFRPADADTGAFTGEDELIVGKQRWGGIGSIPVKLNGKYLRFEER